VTFLCRVDEPTSEGEVESDPFQRDEYLVVDRRMQKVIASKRRYHGITGCDSQCQLITLPT
jgi:hypothetical protein